MRKLASYSILITFILLFPRFSLSQEPTKGDLLWLSIYFEIEERKLQIEEKLKKVESELRAAEQMYKEANELMAEIQKKKLFGTEKEKKNAELAAPFAEKALNDIKKTMEVHKRQIVELRMQLDRLKIEEERLSELRKSIKSQEISGVARGCEGDVTVIELKSKKKDFCSTFSTFNEGDAIVTGNDGKARVNFLDGRGEFVLGSNSALIYSKETSEKEILNLIEGKVHVKVEPKEKFMDKIKNWVEEKKEYTKEWIEKKKKELLDLEFEFCKKNYELIRPGEKLIYTRGSSFENPCSASGVPAAVFGVRGTEFIYEVNGNTLKIYVLEGKIEVRLQDRKQAYEVFEGNEIEIKEDGSVNYQENRLLNRWWEDEY